MLLNGQCNCLILALLVSLGINHAIACPITIDDPRRVLSPLREKSGTCWDENLNRVFISLSSISRVIQDHEKNYSNHGDIDGQAFRRIRDYLERENERLALIYIDQESRCNIYNEEGDKEPVDILVSPMLLEGAGRTCLRLKEYIGLYITAHISFNNFSNAFFDKRNIESPEYSDTVANHLFLSAYAANPEVSFSDIADGIEKLNNIKLLTRITTATEIPTNFNVGELRTENESIVSVIDQNSSAVLANIIQVDGNKNWVTQLGADSETRIMFLDYAGVIPPSSEVIGSPPSLAEPPLAEVDQSIIEKYIERISSGRYTIVYSSLNPASNFTDSLITTNGKVAEFDSPFARFVQKYEIPPSEIPEYILPRRLRSTN